MPVLNVVFYCWGRKLLFLTAEFLFNLTFYSFIGQIFRISAFSVALILSRLRSRVSVPMRRDILILDSFFCPGFRTLARQEWQVYELIGDQSVPSRNKGRGFVLNYPKKHLRA